ncbi:MAG: hypothetical protein G8237_10025 [Magnetococcales bacterium]|nr:hypothetical protein [Magnetococcales bacterium]
MTDLTQPHDKLFKMLLSDPEHAGALLREQLPAPIVALLAPGNPELVPGSFLSPELRPHFSDLLYKARTLEGTDLYFYILIEHKSFPDRRVARQIDRGRSRFLEQWEKEHPDWRLLPAIIPMVLYHGVSTWNIPTDFLSLVEHNASMRPWLLDFTYLLVDLGRIPDARLSAHARLRAGLLTLKYGTHQPESQMQALESITQALQEAPELLIVLLLYMMTTFPTLDRKHIDAILIQIAPQEKNMMQSLFAREIIDQNKETWKLEGRAETLLQLLQERFGTIPKTIQEQIKSAGLDDLKAWSSRILKADSLSAVFQL